MNDFGELQTLGDASVVTFQHRPRSIPTDGVGGIPREVFDSFQANFAHDYARAVNVAPTIISDFDDLDVRHQTAYLEEVFHLIKSKTARLPSSPKAAPASPPAVSPTSTPALPEATPLQESA